MVTEDLASHLQSAHCNQQDDANRPLRSKIFIYLFLKLKTFFIVVWKLELYLIFHLNKTVVQPIAFLLLQTIELFTHDCISELIKLKYEIHGFNIYQFKKELV